MSDCITCGGVQVCNDDYIDYYSLQSDAFYQVQIQCPPGANCSGKTGFSIVCCDGSILSITYPSTYNEAQRLSLKNGLLAQYYRRQAFCDGDSGTGNELFYNTKQTCIVGCPGVLTNWVSSIDEGTFAAPTQDQANRAAYSQACTNAQLTRVCFQVRPNFNPCYCKDVGMTANIYADILVAPSTGIIPAMTWSIIGTLPAGLVFEGGVRTDRKCVIRGTPTQTGNFPFRIIANIGLNARYYDFYLCICELSVEWPDLLDDDALIDATEGEEYSNQMEATSCIAGVTKWEITDGELPDGLELDEDTGEISGTPTESGDFTFTVKMTANCV